MRKTHPSRTRNWLMYYRACTKSTFADDLDPDDIDARERDAASLIGDHIMDHAICVT